LECDNIASGATAEVENPTGIARHGGDEGRSVLRNVMIPSALAEAGGGGLIFGDRDLFVGFHIRQRKLIV
jgi:hypothetical protein